MFNKSKKAKSGDGATIAPPTNAPIEPLANAPIEPQTTAVSAPDNPSPQQPSPQQPSPQQPSPASGSPSRNKPFTGSGFEYLFLAAFSLTLPFIPNTLLLHMLQKPVNPIFSALFAILGYGLFVLMLSLFLKNTHNKQNPLPKSNPLHTLISSSIGVLLLYAMTLTFALIYKYTLQFIPALLEFDGQSILFISLLGVSIVFLLFFLFSGITVLIASIQYALRINDIGKAYWLIIRTMLGQILKTLPFSLLAGILLYLVNLTQNLSLQLLEGFIQPGFYRNFVFYTVGSVINAVLFWAIIVLSRKVLSRIHGTLVEMNAQPHHSKIPVFTAVLVVACMGLTILMVPLGKDASDGILSEVALHHNKGNAVLTMGLTQGAIYEYDLAYSKLLAFKGYLYGLKYISEKTPSFQELSESNLTKASAVAINNPYVPYFRGTLQLKSANPDGAIAAFKQAVMYKNGVVSSYFGLLEAYRQKNQANDIENTLQILENTETYSDALAVMSKYKTSKIDALIEAIEEQEAILGPKMIYKAIEKTRYNDAAGALTDLMALQVLYPKDLQVNYQIARVANDYRTENSNYATVINYAGLFDQLSSAASTSADAAGPDASKISISDSNEAERKLFVAQMYLGADATAQAEQLLKDSTLAYPDNIELGLQYAYVLNQSNKPDDALKVLEGILSKAADNLEARYLSAISHMIKKEGQASLKEMDLFVKAAAADPKATTMLDKNLYNYCIIFYKIFPGAESEAQVEAIKGNQLLFEYLGAIKGWKDKDSEASNKHIDKIFEVRKDLGHLYYMMGVNYYESTVRTGETDFSKAASYYQESLKFLPQHVEGYFALGHCYLKWGKNLEALRAFRKVMDLMPYEDHRVDPYGMSAHAAMQIGSLIQYDVKEAK